MPPSSQSTAETTAETTAAEQAPLPILPPLRLTLPALQTGASQTVITGAANHEGVQSFWPAYWLTASVPAAWRNFSDAELRLGVETGRWELGRSSLTTTISTMPERERHCHPDCRGPVWSSTLKLKYDMGDVGPLKQIGPEVEVGASPATPESKAGGLLRGGFGGKF